MKENTLDEMLTAHLQQEAVAAEPQEEHLGYALLARAAQGSELSRDEELHLGSCAQCAALRDKFVAEYRSRASGSVFQRLSSIQRRLVAGIGGLSGASGLAALVFFMIGTTVAENRLIADVGNENTPPHIMREHARDLGLPPTSTARGGGPQSRDFTILPSDTLTPPGQDNLPRNGLQLFIDKRPCSEAGNKPPLKQPAPVEGWTTGEHTWRIVGPGMEERSGSFVVLNAPQVAKLRERERRQAGDREAQIRLHALYQMDPLVEREIAALPLDRQAVLRKQIDSFRPGLFGDDP